MKNDTPYQRIFILITLFVFILAIGAIAQTKVLINPNVWVKSEALTQNAKEGQSFIGNYPVLDIDSEDIKNALERIGEADGGTLFIVGDFPEGENVITFGKVAISDQYALAGQNTLTYDSISGEPKILKLTYAISPKYKKDIYKLIFSPGVRLVEIVFFDYRLSSEHTRQIESYLALKYSINITKNTESELRHYLNTDDQKVWDFPVDAFYDEEVLGLGKNQALDVFQTQTFSSDSKSTRLTFSESIPIGHMPGINIKDESYLILSKKSQELTTSVCGGENNIQPWKLHFHKWDDSNPPQAFLWFDSIISLDGPPLLSNGIMSLELVYIEVDGGTQITLPLKGLDFSTDYHLILETPQQCDPIATFTFEACNTSNQQPNAVTLRVNDEGLNAEIVLLNRTTAEQNNFIMLQNNAQITDLPSGQYELLVRSNDATLVDKVFWLDACEGMPNGNTTGPVFNQFADPISDPSAFNAQTSYGIVAYPNPLQKQGEVAFHFWGFESSEFSIQVTDQSGRIVHTSTYNYTEGTAPFSYFFSHTGVYNVTLSSPNYTEVKRIVVQ